MGYCTQDIRQNAYIISVFTEGAAWGRLWSKQYGDFVSALFHGACLCRLVEIRCCFKLAFHSVSLRSLQLGNFTISEENNFCAQYNKEIKDKGR